MSGEMSKGVGELGSQLAGILRRLAQVEANQRASQLNNSAIDGGQIVVNDIDGVLRQIIGAQGDGTVTSSDFNGVPIEAPSTPTLQGHLNGVIVTWDGALASGNDLPLDFDHVEVHVSQAPGFIPDSTTLRGAMIKAGSFPVNPLDPAIDYWFALVPVNSSGIAGTASAQADIHPGSVPGAIAPGSITETMISDGAISTPKLAAESVGANQIAANSITSGQIAAGGITSDSIAALAITAGMIEAGALDAQIITGALIQGGIVSATDFIVSSTDGGLFVYATGAQIVRIFDGAGTFPWTCPPGVTSVIDESVAPGGGGAGNDGPGGGGGEYAKDTHAVTQGNVYNVNNGTPGAGGPPLALGGTTNGFDATDNSFTGDGLTTTAHGGEGGIHFGGQGGQGGTGSGSSQTARGGNGGHVPSGGQGSGGGGSGGPAAAGKTGGDSTNARPGSGAPAVAGGGPGGDGAGSIPGHPPVIGPGGGGGGGGANEAGAAGGDPQQKLTYQAGTPILIFSLAGAPQNDPVAGLAVPSGPCLMGVPLTVQGTSGENTPATITGSARTLAIVAPKTVSTDAQPGLILASAATGTVPAKVLVQGNNLTAVVSAVAESWHDLVGFATGWSVSGFAKYRLNPVNGCLDIAIRNLAHNGTTANPDGTIILIAANGLPAAYRPASARRLTAWTDFLRANGAAFEAAGLELETDGSIQCYGMAVANLRVDCYMSGIPLDI